MTLVPHAGTKKSRRTLAWVLWQLHGNARVAQMDTTASQAAALRGSGPAAPSPHSGPQLPPLRSGHGGRGSRISAVSGSRGREQAMQAPLGLLGLLMQQDTHTCEEAPSPRHALLRWAYSHAGLGGGCVGSVCGWSGRVCLVEGAALGEHCVSEALSTGCLV